MSTLTLRHVAIDTYKENVAYLHRECKLYHSEGFQALNKARKGQVVDAALVPASKQRNNREENAGIKKDKVPEDWPENKLHQKDVEARWTKKHGKSHYGYKNHICVDRQHKLIRRYSVTAASVHYSQKFEGLLDAQNSSRDVWADSAHRSIEREQKLKERGYRSHVHRKSSRKRQHAPESGKPIENAHESELVLSASSRNNKGG